MGSTRTVRRILAPRAAVYAALLDPQAVAQWRAPGGMTCVVHELDPREGGKFRVSLTYDAPTERGKTSARTDTYHGYFAKLIPGEQVVEIIEFETANPEFRGEMTITTKLVDAAGGTDVLVVHEGIPPGVSLADNEIGTQMSLHNLAALLKSS